MKKSRYSADQPTVREDLVTGKDGRQQQVPCSSVVRNLNGEPVPRIATLIRVPLFRPTLG